MTHLVIVTPDGTKYHFEVQAVPRRGDTVYLTDVGIGRIDRMVWTFVPGVDGVVRVELSVVDWTAM